MRVELLLPVAAALLAGCATDTPLTTASTPEAVPSGPATSQSAILASTPAPSASTAAITPITLSRTQTAAMQDAFWRVIEDPAWVKVGSYSAGVDPTGVTLVCGAVNTRNSFGVYSGMKPFRGEFRGAEFKPTAVGGANSVTSVTLASCEKAGLPIKLQGS
jgi:hypothetical protein